MAGTFSQNRVEGQLAAAKGTLYTTPAATKTLVKTITLVNSDAVARTVNIYFKNTASRRQIPKDYSLAAGAQLLMSNFVDTLLAGDLIEGDASAANVVDYWVSLVEEV